MSNNDEQLLASLHQQVQRHIRRKWKGGGFRPIQRAAIPPIVQGENCLIISPTAGGKTEAAFLPVLSRIYDDAMAFEDSFHAVIVAPLKALLNDLEDRLKGWVGDNDDITLFKWHGDVSAYNKRKQRSKPSTILLTTPESLDVILSSPLAGQGIGGGLFRRLKIVIVDEAHYFAADSRGAQLSSLLERLQDISDYSMQRIGLSATVGDKDAVGQWLAGGAASYRVIDTPGTERSIEIEHVLISEESPDYGVLLEAKLSQLASSGKTLIFANSKRDVEMTARMLKPLISHVAVHHGSLSKEIRDDSEKLIKSDKAPAVICATSTLELGIDIGDLNRVIQKDRLPSVNSFLQRIGRAGRKTGSAHIILLAATPEDYVLNMAMASLGLEPEKGSRYCEPLRPSRYRYDVLFQQLLMEILRNHGITITDFFQKVRNAYSFSGITESDLHTLIEYFCSQDLLIKQGDLLLLGEKIVKRFGARNFMELYSVFDVNEYFTVYYGDEEIGYVENWFGFSLRPEKSAFQLGGRKWVVDAVDLETKRIFVRLAREGLPPVWHGGSFLVVEYPVARRYHDILAGYYEVQIVSGDVKKMIEVLRKGFGDCVVPEGTMRISIGARKVQINTFAGTMINSAISFLLGELFPQVRSSFDFQSVEVEIKDINVSEMLESLNAELRSVARWSSQDWESFLCKHLTEMRYSRFSEFIPIEFSVKHAAHGLYRLDEVRDYCKSIKTGL